MSSVGLLDPASLVGREVRDRLAGIARDHEIRLLAAAADEDGTLQQIGGEVVLVRGLDDDALDDLDLLILCGHRDEQSEAVARVPDGTSVIGVDGGSGSIDGIPFVSGLGAPLPAGERTVVSPHPGVLLLAPLVEPLAALGLHRTAATLLLPTSLYGEAGLGELFEQTRGILNFQGEMQRDVFPAQLAFNLLPLAGSPAVESGLEAVLGDAATVRVQLVQAPVFHSLSASVFVEGDAEVSADDVLAALSAVDGVVVADDEQPPGPADVAGRDEIVVGRIDVRPNGGGVGLWAVMDNLVRSASNVLEIATGLLRPSD